MGALISEQEAVSFLGLNAPLYELATKHHLPVVQIAGRLYLEARSIPQWREVLAREARSLDAR